MIHDSTYVLCTAVPYSTTGDNTAPNSRLLGRHAWVLTGWSLSRLGSFCPYNKGLSLERSGPLLTTLIWQRICHFCKIFFSKLVYFEVYIFFQTGTCIYFFNTLPRPFVGKLVEIWQNPKIAFGKFLRVARVGNKKKTRQYMPDGNSTLLCQ